MNKKTGYTLAGITAAIIAAASFMPAPDDNPPLASQPVSYTHLTLPTKA